MNVNVRVTFIGCFLRFDHRKVHDLIGNLNVIVINFNIIDKIEQLI